MLKQRRYQLFLNITLWSSIFVLFLLTYRQAQLQTPSYITMQTGKTEIMELHLPATGELYKKIKLEENNTDKDAIAVLESGKSNIPKEKIVVNLQKSVKMTPKSSDSYTMNVKLFGMIPFKTIDIQVINETKLIPAGIPIGIYVKTQGVLVVGTGSFEGMGAVTCYPCEHLLKSGDYIVAVNGNEVNSKKEIMNYIRQGNGEEIILNVRRGEEYFERKVKPLPDTSGTYKIGIWIRDNAQGIGTLTYVDEEKGFGALGHGINDVDTSTLMNLKTGTLYQTEILSIKRGQKGSPGELLGLIDYSKNNHVGTILQNRSCGIFGICDDRLCELVGKKAIPICLRQDVKTGAAQILLRLEGKANYYGIEITQIIENPENVNREIEIEITDPDLLALTGGIVQGMSGAPILQDGKIVGAITHVLVNDPSHGYGIFIENMMEH